uniref:Regulatory protein zeste n=1 Tax=Plectus sambesii TaxID=2011161 RepID=A0A914W9L4_9BILA
MVNARCSQTLHRGSRGECVKVVQQAIGVNADGSFGQQTLAAVMQFQAEKGLTADGIVNSNTWSAIYGTADNGEKKEIFQNEENSAFVIKSQEGEWERIVQALNAQNATLNRTWKEVRKKYYNLASEAKKLRTK